ncbi:MAG: TIGR00282 family metallophosphoesterase [Clostridia bacterium]|nr:TIGR00282 family metallophosphoesterase [Clostridia bacterium]
MRVLCIGDVCSPAGVQKALKYIPKIKKEKNCDCVIVNGENSSEHNAITENEVSLLFCAGADVITGGNHTLRQQSVHPVLDKNPFVLRPDNIKSDYGSGYCLLDKGRYQVAVINLLGQVYIENPKASNPFLCADTLIKQAKNDGAKIIIVDFHAEATSEKKALGFYLDGVVSAVFGTHTHIQTSDIGILEKGTGYITDLGMTGPENSVLGIKKEIIIDRFRDGKSDKFMFAEGECIISGCIFDIDEKTGLCINAESFCYR